MVYCLQWRTKELVYNDKARWLQQPVLFFFFNTW
jgi:hypothetical protein